jgi:BASS family bile acid:Na+ symporter
VSQILPILIKLTGLAFVIASMAAAGLTVKPGEALGELRRVRPVSRAILANFIGAPLLAWLLAAIIPMRPDFAAGLILVGAAAGAPFLPILAQAARGNIAFAIALMVLLVTGSLVVVPVALPVLLPGTHVPTWELLKPLLEFIVLPLCIGMAVRSAWAPAAGRLEPALHRISNVSLLVFFALVVWTHLGALWAAVGSGAILASMLFTIVLGAATYAPTGLDAGTRRVLALGTAQRNVAAALVTAKHSFADRPDVEVMVLVCTIVGLLIVFGAARAFARSGSSPTEGVSDQHQHPPASQTPARPRST